MTRYPAGLTGELGGTTLTESILHLASVVNDLRFWPVDEDWLEWNRLRPGAVLLLAELVNFLHADTECGS